jgi:hypothetical protein
MRHLQANKQTYGTTGRRRRVRITGAGVWRSPPLLRSQDFPGVLFKPQCRILPSARCGQVRTRLCRRSRPPPLRPVSEVSGTACSQAAPSASSFASSVPGWLAPQAVDWLPTDEGRIRQLTASWYKVDYVERGRTGASCAMFAAGRPVCEFVPGADRPSLANCNLRRGGGLCAVRIAWTDTARSAPSDARPSRIGGRGRCRHGREISRRRCEGWTKLGRVGAGRSYYDGRHIVTWAGTNPQRKVSAPKDARKATRSTSRCRCGSVAVPAGVAAVRRPVPAHPCERGLSPGAGVAGATPVPGANVEGHTLKRARMHAGANVVADALEHPRLMQD